MKKIKVVMIVLAAAVVIGCGGFFGMKALLSSESKTTKIGFENIGELATQSAYCTQVNVTDASREFNGVTIPFTQSKYVYSYDFVIKAGFEFGEIEGEKKGNTIEVRLPEAKILSNEIDLDSFQVYVEDESIFRQITLEENNEALETLKQDAQDNAVANGLLDNARENAQTILRGFFASAYDPEDYDIVFLDK